MFKWVVGLFATIYVTLLVFGAPPKNEVVVTQKPVAKSVATAFVALDPTPVSYVPKHIAVPAPIAKFAAQTPVEVSSLSSTQTSPDVEKKPNNSIDEFAPDPRGVGEIWRVTGSRVNLRKAATTRSSVVGKTLRGESAEVLELIDTGWARVFIIESGIEAYMSAKFISRDG